MYQRCNCYSRTVCNNKDSYSVSPSSTEYSNYLKAYGEVLADLIKDKDTNFKEINPHYLNDKDLLEKYVLYIHKDDIPSGDDKDCVVDYFMTEEKNSSSYLNISFLAIVTHYSSKYL